MILLGIELLGQGRNPACRIDGKGVFAAHTVAIGPMRRHPGFRHIVHLASADLHLDPFAVPARNGGMDRPVAVAFRLANVILEPPRHRAPALMDRAQRTIAVFLVQRDDPEPVDIREPGKSLLLFLHLAPDRIGLLGATEYLGLDSRLFQFLAHVAGDARDHVTGFPLQGDESADDRLPPFGVQHPERQILKLFAHPLHTHTTGQRRVDIHRLAGLLHLLVGTHRLDRAHVVQPVGQLDKDDPQVLGHRHEKLAEILRLLGLDAGKLQVRQLGDAIDQPGHLVAKFLRDLAIGRLGVLDGVMQQGGDDRRVIQPLFRQDGGHGNRMAEIGLARMPELPFMHGRPIGIGVPQALYVCLRIVVADQLDQIVC